MRRKSLELCSSCSCKLQNSPAGRCFPSWRPSSATFSWYVAWIPRFRVLFVQLDRRSRCIKGIIPVSVHAWMAAWIQTILDA